jgi:hypothetical protein
MWTKTLVRVFLILAFVSLGSFQQANSFPDKQYHQVKKTADGKYVKPNGADFVSLETMYVDLDGWGVDDPRVKKPEPKSRQVQFHKAYLEVAESGRLFDRNQKEAILAKIDQFKKEGRAVYVVTFIHGWHHNAYDDFDLKDSASLNRNTIKFPYFVARYAEHSRRLFELNGAKNAPVVLSIYVGWRGEINTGALSNLTIGDRAKAADQIALADGDGTLKDALGDIAVAMRTGHEDSRMLVLGHSLGGRMLSIMFLNDITEKRKFQPLGKQVLIVALQPAISADCYSRVFTGDRVFGSRNTPPSFIALTSEDDEALYYYFKVARETIAYVPPPACENYDRDNEDKFVTAIGLHKPFVTHRLNFEHVGDLGRGNRYPDSLLVPGKVNLRYPLIDKERRWMYKAGKTIWYYPHFNLPGTEPDPVKNYNIENALLFTLHLRSGEAWSYAGAVWNIRTNKNLIDTGEGALHSEPGKVSALHNAFASTGVADILSRIMYASKESWSPDEPVPNPKSAPALPGFVVPEPNRSNRLDAPGPSDRR